MFFFVCSTVFWVLHTPWGSTQHSEGAVFAWSRGGREAGRVPVQRQEHVCGSRTKMGTKRCEFGGLYFLCTSLWSQPVWLTLFKNCNMNPVLLQNQLFYFPGGNMCLTAHQDHPSLARCNPSDRYQQWSFIWLCKTHTLYCMHEHTGTHAFNNAGFVCFFLLEKPMHWIFIYFLYTTEL